MAYKAKAYTLREESTESGIRYFISFKDGQGEHHELEVSEQLFFEFRQMERRNRNLLQWDERHREFSEVWDETLNRRALKLPKSIEEQMIEAERAELLCKAVDRLPEIQRRRFLLYYEYEFNFYQIAAMEHCTAYPLHDGHDDGDGVFGILPRKSCNRHAAVLLSEAARRRIAGRKTCHKGVQRERLAHGSLQGKV